MASTEDDCLHSARGTKPKNRKPAPTCDKEKHRGLGRLVLTQVIGTVTLLGSCDIHSREVGRLIASIWSTGQDSPGLEE